MITHFGAWAAGEPGDQNSNDNWLPLSVSQNFDPTTTTWTITYTDGQEGFLYPGWGAPGGEDARAFSTSAGVLGEYYLPVGNIPYDARLHHISWVWNGFNDVDNTHGPPNFDVDIKVYLYCGFSGDKIPDNADTYTYTWVSPTSGACGRHTVTDETLSTNERPAVSISIQGKNGSASGIDVSATPAEYVQWKGSFSIGLGFIM